MIQYNTTGSPLRVKNVKNSSLFHPKLVKMDKFITFSSPKMEKFFTFSSPKLAKFFIFSLQKIAKFVTFSSQKMEKFFTFSAPKKLYEAICNYQPSIGARTRRTVASRIIICIIIIEQQVGPVRWSAMQCNGVQCSAVQFTRVE